MTGFAEQLANDDYRRDRAAAPSKEVDVNHSVQRVTWIMDAQRLKLGSRDGGHSVARRPVTPKLVLESVPTAKEGARRQNRCGVSTPACRTSRPETIFFHHVASHR